MSSNKEKPNEVSAFYTKINEAFLYENFVYGKTILAEATIREGEPCFIKTASKEIGKEELLRTGYSHLFSSVGFDHQNCELEIIPIEQILLLGEAMAIIIDLLDLDCRLKVAIISDDVSDWNLAKVSGILAANGLSGIVEKFIIREKVIFIN